MTQDGRSTRTVAVDAMGGDHAPEVVVRGAVAAAREGVHVQLVGHPVRVRELLGRSSRVHRLPIEVVPATDVIEMDEAPTQARRRAGASIRRACRLVAADRAGSVLSCGNSGAALISAVVEIGVLDGVGRPAIATVIPRTDGGRLVLLDAGANVDCRADQLANFALLGTAYARANGIGDPRVGVLSIGTELNKGNALVREVHRLLETMPILDVGNVEPTGAIAGACDVLVCDGFVGNVMLKSVEGAAEAVLHLLKEEIRRDAPARFGAWLLGRALRRFRRRAAWEAQGGGILLGVDGVVVVGHGRATVSAVRSGILLASQAADMDLVGSIREDLGVIAPE